MPEPQPYPVTEGGNLPMRFEGWCLTRPIIKANCNRCLLCWVFCPEGVIQQAEDGLSIDYRYCKGCGICAHECPIGAVEMR